MKYEDILETNHIRRFFIDMLVLALVLFMFILFLNFYTPHIKYKSNKECIIYY